MGPLGEFNESKPENDGFTILPDEPEVPEIPEKTEKSAIIVLPEEKKFEVDYYQFLKPESFQILDYPVETIQNVGLAEQKPRRRKNQAFAIIAEPHSVLNSRSSSPNGGLPPLNGRVSPFRGRGFKPPNSVSPTPSNSTKSSISKIPVRRKSSESDEIGYQLSSSGARKYHTRQRQPILAGNFHSKSLTNISSKNLLGPNKRGAHLTGRNSYLRLSPIVGSSPEPSTPSRTPRSKSQPPSRLGSRNVSRSGSPNLGSPRSKIPKSRSYRTLNSKKNEKGLPKNSKNSKNVLKLSKENSSSTESKESAKILKKFSFREKSTQTKKKSTVTIDSDSKEEDILSVTIENGISQSSEILQNAANVVQAAAHIESKLIKSRESLASLLSVTSENFGSCRKESDASYDSHATRFHKQDSIVSMTSHQRNPSEAKKISGVENLLEKKGSRAKMSIANFAKTSQQSLHKSSIANLVKQSSQSSGPQNSDGTPKHTPKRSPGPAPRSPSKASIGQKPSLAQMASKHSSTGRPSVANIVNQSRPSTSRKASAQSIKSNVSVRSNKSNNSQEEVLKTPQSSKKKSFYALSSASSMAKNAISRPTSALNPNSPGGKSTTSTVSSHKFKNTAGKVSSVIRTFGVPRFNHPSPSRASVTSRTGSAGSRRTSLKKVSSAVGKVGAALGKKTPQSSPKISNSNSPKSSAKNTPDKRESTSVNPMTVVKGVKKFGNQDKISPLNSQTNLKDKESSEPIQILVKEKSQEIEVESMPSSATNGLRGVPTEESQAETQEPQTTDNPEKNPGCFSRLFGCCSKKSQSSDKNEKNLEKDDETTKKPTGCMGCCKSSKKDETKIDIENEKPEKKSFFSKMCCSCKKNRISDSADHTSEETTGCFGKKKKKKSEGWADKRDSIMGGDDKAGCCSCCKLWKKIFCCCCACKCCDRCLDKMCPREKRPSQITQKKSMTSTIPPPIEDTRPKLDLSLVEHTSHMRGAIPVLPIPVAYICMVLNVFLPGVGTVMSGLICLCIGKPRFSPRDGAKQRIGAFIIDIIVGFSQFFCVIFCLVGWGWSIWWGFIMIKVAKKYRKIKHTEKLKAEQAAAAEEDVEKGR